jgi:hypothetical protein
MEPHSSGSGRRAFKLTVSAFLWGVALVVAAFVVPLYGSTSASAPSGFSRPSAALTLVQVNGLGVLVPVGVPVLLAAGVWFALHRKCTTGSRSSGYLAAALIVLLTMFCLFALASIGLLVLPIAGLLAAAAWLTPSGAELTSR